LSKKNPGKCKLKINVLDEHENISVDLQSTKYMIDPSNELLKELDRMEDVRYQILTSA
jgi:DNA polymerase-3 subunit alpha